MAVVSAGVCAGVGEDLQGASAVQDLCVPEPLAAGRREEGTAKVLPQQIHSSMYAQQSQSHSNCDCNCCSEKAYNLATV